MKLEKQDELSKEISMKIGYKAHRVLVAILIVILIYYKFTQPDNSFSPVLSLILGIDATISFGLNWYYRRKYIDAKDDNISFPKQFFIGYLITIIFIIILFILIIQDVL